ncbi:unnamed protein product, partial [Mesorhabditis belari]|uniref:Uncharacterized protein n=1 Tax=Mesorhabditis belari TaxID=2138241 RepID=A0AAF3F0Y8_9BILA
MDKLSKKHSFPFKQSIFQQQPEKKQMDQEMKPLPIKIPDNFGAKPFSFNLTQQQETTDIPSSSILDLNLLAHLGIPINEEMTQEIQVSPIKQRRKSRDKGESTNEKSLESPSSEEAGVVSGKLRERNGGRIRPSGRPPKYLADANVVVDILDDSPHGYVETTPHIRKLRQNLATQQCRLNRERNVRAIIFKFSDIVERWKKESEQKNCTNCNDLFDGVDDTFLTMLRDEADRERKRLERKTRITEIASSTATVRHLLT